MSARAVQIVTPAWLLGIAVVALLAGCSAPAEGTATAEPSATPSEEASTEVPCPNPDGGTCLGRLAAGEYETTTFTPQITYTVPEGWMNMEDLPGNFLLHLQEDEDGQNTPRGGSFLGIYSNIHAASIDCREAWQDGVGTAPGDLVAWYQTVPGLVVSEPLEVSVGGLTGLQIDVGFQEGLCSFDGMAGTPLIMGDGVSDLHHGNSEGIDIRLVFLEWGDDGNVTLEMTSVQEQHTADDFRAELQPIIESLEFARS